MLVAIVVVLGVNQHLALCQESKFQSGLIGADRGPRIS
jgi:hypothetical protein